MKRLFLSLIAVPSAFAQGPTIPPGAPGPTQRSLQEVWDALAAQRSVVDANAANLKTTVSLQSSVSASLGALASTGLSDDTARFDFFTIGQGTGVGRECVLTILSSGEIVAAYLDETQNDLKIARNGSGSWVTETIDFDARGPLAISQDVNGQPSVLFYNPDDPETYQSTFNGSNWQQRQVSITSSTLASGPFGVPTHRLISENGRQSVVWIDSVTGNLIYAESGGGAWQQEVIRDIGLTQENLLSSPDLTYHPNGDPIVVVYARLKIFLSESSVIYVIRRNSNGIWTTTELDSDFGEGARASRVQPYGVTVQNFLGVVKASYLVVGYKEQFYTINGVTTSAPTGVIEEVYNEYTWDVSVEPFQLISGLASGALVTESFVDRSTGTLSFDYRQPFITYENVPLLEASTWNSQPVEVCGASRPSGRIAVAIRRPYENDFIIAVEKP